MYLTTCIRCYSTCKCYSYKLNRQTSLLSWSLHYIAELLSFIFLTWDFPRVRTVIIQNKHIENRGKIIPEFHLFFSLVRRYSFQSQIGENNSKHPKISTPFRISMFTFLILPHLCQLYTRKKLNLNLKYILFLNSKFSF